MEKLIEQIRLKADACGDATKEQRARKGAYVDCIVMIKEALHKPDVIASCEQRAGHTREQLPCPVCVWAVSMSDNVFGVGDVLARLHTLL
jgi:hypothetical protein